MEKIEVNDFFGGMDAVYLNNEKLTVLNINKFKLYLRYSDDEVDYFTITKTAKNVGIYHWKQTGCVNWFGGTKNSVPDSIQERKDELYLLKRDSIK